MARYNGTLITFDHNRDAFVGNDGKGFAFKFTNKENVGEEVLEFGLSAEAAEFVAISILEQLKEVTG